MQRRVGIIGLGDIARKAYLPVLSVHEGVEIVGVMSRTAATVASVAAQYRIPGKAGNLAELLSCEPDAVFIHAPTPSHAELVIECLRQGIHVYVDKPLSYDIRESEAMIDAAAKSGCLLAVGFNRRFAPLYREARAWVEEAGSFQLCAAEKHRLKPQRHSAKETLYDDLIHMLDLLIWLGGEQWSLDGYAQQVDEAGRLSFASGNLTFTSGSGQDPAAAASFAMSRAAGWDLERLELHGAGRSVQVVNLEQAFFSDKESGTRQRSFGSWESVSYRRGFTGAIEHFLAAIDVPSSCMISADKTWSTHLLVEKLADRYNSRQLRLDL